MLRIVIEQIQNNKEVLIIIMILIFTLRTVLLSFRLKEVKIAGLKLRHNRICGNDLTLHQLNSFDNLM